MPPYRAGSGGGMFGSSVYPDSRPKVDVGGVIDSITGGASTMIRAAYQRRLAENQLAIEAEQRKQAADQIAYQRGRDQVADRQHADEFAYRKTKDAEAASEKALTDRRAAIEHGFVPAHTETKAVPTPAVTSVGPVPGAPRSRSAVRTAMQPQMAKVAAPAIESAPIRTSTPVNTEVTVPETYDPEKSAKFALEKERAETTAHENTVRASRQVELKQLGGQLAESLAKLRAKLHTSASGSTVARAMTGNKLEDARKNAAVGLIGMTNGSYDEAVSYLNGPDGAALRAEGVKPEHLMYAHAEYAKSATAQAMRVQTTGLGASPAEAVSQVKTTRQLVGGSPKLSKAAPASPDTSTTSSAKPPAEKPAATAATPARRPLGADAKARAQSDTAFASFLKEKGYTPADWGKK